MHVRNARRRVERTGNDPVGYIIVLTEYCEPILEPTVSSRKISAELQRKRSEHASRPNIRDVISTTVSRYTPEIHSQQVAAGAYRFPYN